MALSVPTPRVMRNADAYKFVDVLVTSGQTIYPGALCAIVAATGAVSPAATSTTLRFGGVSIGNKGDMQTVVGDGTLTVRLVYSDAEVLVPCASTTVAAKLFTQLFCVDDSSVTDVSSSVGPGIGLMTEVESSGVTCWVLLRGVSPALSS